MYDGIFIGKCSPSTMNFIKTFVIRDGVYYFLTHKTKLTKTSNKDSAKGMFKAAPVILAFWSEEE